MISVLILMVAGFLVSGSLWRQRRVLTLVACAGVLVEAAWLMLTLLARTVFVGSDSGTVYLIGSLILLGLAGGLSWAKGWHRPYKMPGSGVRDLMVGLVLLPVLGASWFMWQYNGLQADGSLVWHGFFNGDTVTLLTLVKRAGVESGLTFGNPFSGLGALEYPTLLHAGWLEFWQQIGFDGDAMLYFLPLVTWLQILLTIPLFWMLWDEILPEPFDGREQWLGVPKRWFVYLAQAGIVGWLVSLSWDNYIYPQSHFFLTGMFLLASVVWLKAGRQTGRDWQLHLGLGFVLSSVLMLSNAVTGTAALVVAVAALGWRALERKAMVTERQEAMALAVGLVGLFLLAMPGEPAFGAFNFSYTAAFDVARLAGPVLLVVAAMYWSERLGGSLPAMVASLMLATVGVFLFSSRNIVVENASRFLYHALLVGFPLLGAAAVRLYYWTRQRLWYESRPLAERLSLGVVGLTMIFLLIVPGLQSMASAHDNLQFKDERIIDVQERDLMWWIEDNVPVGSVIVAHPENWLHLPALTGRALLRTDYWLSADDVVLSDLQAAFGGDLAAREQVLRQGDYLLLTKEERAIWGPVLGAKVYENGEAVIFEL